MPNPNDLAEVGRRIDDSGQFTDEATVSKELAQLALRPDTNVTEESLSTSVGRLVSAYIVAGAMTCKQAAAIETLKGSVILGGEKVAGLRLERDAFRRAAEISAGVGRSAAIDALHLGTEAYICRTAAETALRSRTLTPSMRRKVEKLLKQADEARAAREATKQAPTKQKPESEPDCYDPLFQ